MTGEKVNNDFRILILAPVGKDARLIFGTLRSEGFQSQICSDVANLISEIKAGVGAVLLTEEILLLPESSCLSDLMSTQASWSDIPILAFYGKRDGLLPTKTRYLTRFQKVTNVTFLERPISKATLISATKAAVRDRTRQYTVKELVNQLQQEKEKAETASKAKSQFLANMSHEIRTPLGAILGFAELAMDPLQPEKEHLESLRTIVRNSEQLSVLINDILDLSKVEAGHMLVEKVSFSLFELIQEVDKLLSVRAKRKGIALGFYFDSALPVNIVSDPTRLRQILINLIGNAIKFTDKGSVLVSISFESSQNNDAAGILSFKVKDTGIGISPEHRKLLFKPFVQGTVSVTRSFGGTGLGLVLSRRLAEALGGKLDIIDSKVREGTTLEFSAAVEVPAEAEFSLDLTNFEKEKSHPKTKPSELLLSGISVLVVDDAADDRKLRHCSYGYPNAEKRRF
jgi:signal transduction histidine kinase